MPSELASSSGLPGAPTPSFSLVSELPFRGLITELLCCVGVRFAFTPTHLLCLLLLMVAGSMETPYTVFTGFIILKLSQRIQDAQLMHQIWCAELDQRGVQDGKN